MKFLFGEWFFDQPVRGVMNLAVSVGIMASAVSRHPDMVLLLLAGGAYLNSMYAGRSNP